MVSRIFSFLLEKAGTSPIDFLQMLEKSNFRIFHISEKDHKIVPIKIEDYLSKVNSKNKRCTNLLCVRK